MHDKINHRSAHRKKATQSKSQYLFIFEYFDKVVLVAELHNYLSEFLPGLLYHLNTRSCKKVLDIPDLDLHYRKSLIWIRALSLDNFQGLEIKQDNTRSGM